jgi:hypothetical protein
VRWVLGRLFGVPALLAAACGTQAASGYPLYAKVGDGPGRDKVALLYGPVQTVDDVDVAAKGKTFELLPGCHVVTLQKSIGAGTASGAWAMNVGRLVIPFRMKAAHIYTIKMEIEDASGPVGRARIVAREKDPGGSVVEVGFAGSEDDVLMCRRWAEAQGL